MVNIKSKILSDVKKIRKKEEDKIQIEFRHMMNDILNDAIVKLIIKGHIQSGKLVDSFYYNQVSDNEYVVGNSAPQSIYLEKGTPPHYIYSQTGKNLVFETKKYQPWNNFIKRPIIGRDGGFLKVTRYVSHPGVEAEWFLLESIQSNWSKFKKKLL